MTDTTETLGYDEQAANAIRPSSGLTFVTIADLCAKVDAAGPRRWLLRGFWPAGEYGVHSAEMKAQKTWNTVDLAVSVASGTPWLETVPVDDPGPVIMFAGEGSESNLVRRVRAVCGARDLKAEELQIVICTRAPHLSNRLHLAEMAAQIDEVRPTLVTLDPFYLAARGANSSQLYEMGALLEGPQIICQAAEASLWVVTHNNRKEGKGASRITGAGPAEWGRILVTANIVSRHTDAHTKETTVLTAVDFIGGEIADQALRIVRRIRSDDPDDLDAPLHYAVIAEDTAADGTGDNLTPAENKLLTALRSFGDQPVSASRLVDHVAQEHGHGLRRETVSRAMKVLVDRGYADHIEPIAVGKPGYWLAADCDAK